MYPQDQHCFNAHMAILNTTLVIIKTTQGHHQDHTGSSSRPHRVIRTHSVILKTAQGHQQGIDCCEAIIATQGPSHSPGNHQDHTGSSSRPHRVNIKPLRGIRTHSVILKTTQGHQQGIDCCEAIIATQGPSHSPGNHQDHTGSSSRPHRVNIKPLRGIRTHSVILKTTQGHQQGIDCCVAIIATQGPSHSPGNRLLCSHHGYTGAFTQPRESIAVWPSWLHRGLHTAQGINCFTQPRNLHLIRKKKKILYPLIGFHSDNAVLILHFQSLFAAVHLEIFNFHSSSL